jgi:hypothetical protein
MAASDDLSGGDVSFYEKARIHGDIEEERQRQTWKGRVLWTVAVLILVFVATFLMFVLNIYWRLPEPLPTNEILLLGILAAIPSLLLINFMRLVSKPSNASGVFEQNPWVALLREITQTIADAVKK